MGGDQSTTLNVIYQNVRHILKFMNPPGYSGHCWCGLRNPRWPPDINVGGCYIGFGVPIQFILINKINGIHFLSLCLNFFMIHLNIVSIARSRSNSRSHKKKQWKKAYFPDVFCNYRKVCLNGKKCYISK